ncbi:MAG: protein kinase [Pseudomonadota bacterium]
MNAKSSDIRQKLASELSNLGNRLDGNARNAELIASIQREIGRLLEASGGSEAGIRRVLTEQYRAGELREDSYYLLESMLDRFVTEQIPTAPTSPEKGRQSDVSATQDDEYASTTVLDKFDIPKSEAEERVQVGSVLRDRFLLQERISGGSMGVVYKALDRRLAEAGEARQWVAIKVLSPQLAENADALRALQQEAAKGRNLAHPNIVRFIDFDRDDDLYFIVMEWLDGRTLAEILDTPGSKQLEIDEALEIVRQVGKALDYAHRCGIVHADVKPGNVMILKDGSAKLFDFGVARVWQKTEASATRFDPVVLGAMTPAYSSMQVITGEVPTPADDVFSLACLLYRLLAGYRAYGPRNAAEACEEGMTVQALPGLSKQQWEAVRKALSFSRVTRFESMTAFLDALNATSIEKIAAEPRGNVHSKEPGDVGKWLIALAAVAIVAGFTAFQLGYLDRWLSMLPQNASLPADGIASDNVPAGDAPALDMLPDGAPSEPAEAAGPAQEFIIDLEPEPDMEPPVELRSTATGTRPRNNAGSLSGGDAADTRPPVASLDLPPADVEVPLDRSGIDRAIGIALREDGAPVVVDLLRLGSLDSSLGVRLEEVDHSGNRSPFRTGQYFASGSGVIGFAAGQDRARFELVMASDPLREADQQSTLKIRAAEGDSSGLAHITISLEDDDQRAFEQQIAPNTVGFAVSQMSVGEQDPAVQVDIVRYNPNDSVLRIEYAVSDITATDGDDYFSPGGSFVSFAPGQRSARLLVPLVQDSRHEGDEAFVVTLVGEEATVTEGVYRRVAIMIRDDDPPPASPTR